ncbi:hypothetical protein [Solimonas fluminis]|uniref:hypothetical protein n=1 Tax=Solimonas fluminis TaxID=2086571 RepID=UPI0010571473|nr:hypothetical protein [Solimonas fluminis]
MNRIARGCAGVLAGVLFSGTAAAADPFELDLTVGQDNKQFGFDNVDDAAEALDRDNLLREFPQYTETTTVLTQINFRGLNASLDFPQADTTLVFEIEGVELTPGSNSVSFQGQTRDDSIEQLKDFLKKNKFALKNLQTRSAQATPIDPLAGNPGSLMNQRMRGDFDRGFTHRVSQIWGCGCSAFDFSQPQPIMVAAADDMQGIFAEARARAAALRGENEVGIGLAGQSLRGTAANGTKYRSTQLQLPFSYTVKFDSDPRRKLSFELPLSYTDSEGAASYSAGFSVAYTHPVSDNWSLTPAAGIGATGSEDLGAGGGLASYSLTSSYTHRLGDWALSMGNSIGRYESVGIKIGDIEAEYDVQNTVFTNGLLVTGPTSLIARGIVMEYSFTDTRLTGTDLFSNRYDEVGIGLGFIKTDSGVITRYFKTGLSYLWGENDIKGVRLALNLRF